MRRDPEVGAALRATPTDALRDIVARCLEQARAPYRAAAASLASPDVDVEDRARAAFDEGDEIGIAALFDVAGLAPAARGWQIATVTDAALELRREVLRAVRTALSDRAPLAPDAKKGPRVCDEAFLLVRELVPLPPASPAATLDRAAFLALPKWKRDTLIRELGGARSVRRTLGELVP